MKTFIIHWLDAKDEELTGIDIADALRRAGYTSEAIRAIDWYEEKK